LVGIDNEDSKTLGSEGYFKNDYTQFLKLDGLKGKRIGLLTDVMGYHHKVDTLIQKTVNFLESKGAEVIEIEFPKGNRYGQASFQVMLFEFKDGLNKYFASLGNDAPVRNLTDLIEFNKSDAIELRYFDQKIIEMAQEKGDLESAEYKEALATMLKATREQGIDLIMEKHKLDAIMAPTGSPAWKTDLVNGDNFMGGSSSFAAIAGYPAITVPMGFINELPVGVSFFGRAWSEPLLLEIAYAYEQGTNQRRAPKFLATDQ